MRKQLELYVYTKTAEAVSIEVDSMAHNVQISALWKGEDLIYEIVAYGKNAKASKLVLPAEEYTLLHLLSEAEDFIKDNES